MSQLVFIKTHSSRNKIVHIGSFHGTYFPLASKVPNSDFWLPMWCDHSRVFQDGDEVWRPEDKPEDMKVCKRCIRSALGRMWRPITVDEIRYVFETRLKEFGMSLESCREDDAKLVLLVKYQGRDVPMVAWSAREELLAVFQVNGKAYNEHVELYNFDSLRWCYEVPDGVDRNPSRPDVDRLYAYLADTLAARVVDKNTDLVTPTKQWQDESEEALF